LSLTSHTSEQIPYFIVTDAQIALYWSIAFTAAVLLLFGAFKSYYTGAELGVRGYIKGMLSTLAVGGVAAGASFGIVRALEI
jgi:VIT1/CCC1 family predicted Fe2+/Mn2+ transporter